jgi:hypothetical protein
MIENISKVNGLNLSRETIEELEQLLKNELYQDIDSEFAKEIQEELDKRYEKRGK